MIKVPSDIPFLLQISPRLRGNVSHPPLPSGIWKTLSLVVCLCLLLVVVVGGRSPAASNRFVTVWEARGEGCGWIGSRTVFFFDHHTDVTSRVSISASTVTMSREMYCTKIPRICGEEMFVL